MRDLQTPCILGQLFLEAKALFFSSVECGIFQSSLCATLTNPQNWSRGSQIFLYCLASFRWRYTVTHEEDTDVGEETLVIIYGLDLKIQVWITDQIIGDK